MAQTAKKLYEVQTMDTVNQALSPEQLDLLERITDNNYRAPRALTPENCELVERITDNFAGHPTIVRLAQKPKKIPFRHRHHYADKYEKGKVNAHLSNESRELLKKVNGSGR